MSQAQKKGYDGPRLGVKVANENKRNFTPEKLAESNKIIGLQYGSNRGASQAGMGAFGNSRKILPDGKILFLNLTTKHPFLVHGNLERILMLFYVFAEFMRQ